MNKTAIKNFAVEARKKLIASVKDKAALLGITQQTIFEAVSSGEGYAVFPTQLGIETTLKGKELRQRESLVRRIKEKGYSAVIEGVAFTWFNRLITVRFMEVNDYLPSRVRILSSEIKGKYEPDIVTQAPNVDFELTPDEIQKILHLKEKNLDELFRFLFIKQCSQLGEILPGLFENTSAEYKDYTEILFNLSYTNEDGIIRDLLELDEADFFEEVEIIGWMYQYYNTEPKNETFALLKKNIKITKERIPAATQLFTPDWIVRYMVENSLGRFWLEGHPDETLKSRWEYYLDEAEQAPEVIAELGKIRVELKNINPEDIKLIDPSMGSGHILVYAFELLMQIYEACGYAPRDAARLIVEKNIYGLDIDDRACQLAYFAIMMKGRKYDRRFLTRGIIPNLYAIQESNSFEFQPLEGLFAPKSVHADHDTINSCQETGKYLIHTFKDAKEFGTILTIEPRDYEDLKHYLEGLLQNRELDQTAFDLAATMLQLIKQAKLMSQKYDVVITNPPYMGASGMDARLAEYVKKNYPDSKSDLFAVFIQKGLEMTKDKGYNCMVTMQSWMFLSSFEKMRRDLITKRTITNLMHMENMVMGIAFGTAVTVFRNLALLGYNGTFNQIRLIDLIDNKPKEFPVKGNRLAKVSPEKFLKIPGMPIAYWVSDQIYQCFAKGTLLDEIANPRQGLATGDNTRFLRLWFEVESTSIGLKMESTAEFHRSEKKYAPYNKGGDYRKWYGNFENVIRFDRENYQILATAGNHLPSRQYYFMEGITWSFVSSSYFGVRYTPAGSVFDVGGSSVFPPKEILMYLTGLMCSKLSTVFMNILNPTINFQVGDVKKIPVIIDEHHLTRVNSLVTENITLSKEDWDSFETSWDFEQHPLIRYKTSSGKLQDAFANWKNIAGQRFRQLQTNEEELNRFFIEIYGLQEELTPEIEDKDLTIHKADLQRDVRSFISYAVGCMFGRYSLDARGLAYAGGAWDYKKYKNFLPDQDNILLITDDEYFEDDIVSRFISFVQVVYGEAALEENLEFIAHALGYKGSTSREAVRNYFVKDFIKEHRQVYRKRPIYWLFDSGKENGFKALIYLHRYDEDTVGRIRTDYLHKTQAALENALSNCDAVLESNAVPSDKAKAVKQKEKLVKQLAETRLYDQAIAHIAYQRISLDLDNGVIMNYAKFQGVEISSEGKKSVKVDLLAGI